MTAFRCEFFRPFRNLVLFSLGLGTLGMIPALWGRVSVSAFLVGALVAAAAGLAVCALFVAALMCFRIHATPEHLRCYDFWGRYLPLFLAGQSRFDDLARAYSPPASPLVRALEEAARAARG